MKKAVSDLLASFTPAVRGLALATRTLVLEIMPDALEQADPADNLIGYGYGQRMAEAVCVIMPLEAGLNLGIYDGASLPDPAGLLAGTGKRHRHVKIESPADLESPELRALLEAAKERKKK